MNAPVPAASLVPPANLPLPELLLYWDEIDQKGTYIPGIRALCLTDRYYLLVKVCGRHDMLHPWIYDRCREVEVDPSGYLDLWSREHYKSTIITFGGCIQEILRDPEITIGIFGHSNVIAEPFLKQIKAEFERNEILKTAFPEIFWKNPSKEAKQWSNYGITIKRKGNPKECTIEASGLDSQPIGKHYRLRIYDDAVVPESVSTPEQIQKSINNYSMSQSLGVVGGHEWMCGTIYSFADLYDWVLKRGALKPRIYPATHDGTREGNPVYFSEQEWKKRLVKNTDSDIACQYLMNPLSGEQRMFDVQQLGEYDVRPSTLSVYVMCDPARSKKKDSANTAVIVLGLDSQMNKYLLDGFNHKMDLKERWEHFSLMYKKWSKAPGVQMIKMGYETFGAQADMDYFQEQMRLPGNPRFDVHELAWPRDGEGSKNDRVQRLVPDCRTGKLLFPRPTDPNRLTSNQKHMKDTGYDYRISRAIRRKDENGQIYDLTEQIRLQFHYFPVGKKDAIDAFARIYDMNPVAPRSYEERYAEPEFV